MARRFFRWLGAVVAGLILLCTGLWGALAIWFCLAPTPPLREILASVFLLVAFAAVACLVLRRWWSVALYGVCFAVALGWWATLQPSNNRSWAEDVARTTSGIVVGDRLVVHDVR